MNIQKRLDPEMLRCCIGSDEWQIDFGLFYNEPTELDAYIINCVVPDQGAHHMTLEYAFDQYRANLNL